MRSAAACAALTMVLAGCGGGANRVSAPTIPQSAASSAAAPPGAPPAFRVPPAPTFAVPTLPKLAIPAKPSGERSRSGASATASQNAFFNGQQALANGVYYLQFANGTPFGYYSFLNDQHYIYHFDAGYEYVFDSTDPNTVYMYDFASGHFWYTGQSTFPYVYDFSLKTFLYYYPASQAGHYTTGPRYFYNYLTSQIITLPTAPAADTHIYVSREGEIDIFNSNGDRTSPTIPELGAYGPAVDANGKIYFVVGNTLKTYDANGAQTTPTIDLTSPLGGGSLSRYLAVGADGKIYVQQGSPSRIVTFGADGQQIAPTIDTATNDPSAYGYHTGVAVGPSGTIYASFLNGATGSGFEAFDQSGARGLIVNSGFSSACGIAVDQNSKVYVADCAAGLVLTFNASGTRTTPTISVHNPIGIAIDKIGKIYIASAQNGRSDDPQSSNMVTVYDAAGHLIGPSIALSPPGTRAYAPQGIAVH